MTLLRLVALEILHRKWNFLLAVAVVALATATFLLTAALLKQSDVASEALVAAKVKETQRAMNLLEDNLRKSMKGLGFNIHIFPEGQDRGEVYSQGYASKTMPEEYVERLAKSKIVTINHLLPALVSKVTWPEKQRTILLIGIRGEVPMAHRNPLEPMIEPVAPGTVVLGSELHQSLGYKAGDALVLLGRTFKVAKCHEMRGSKDDITAWIHLGEAQELLDRKGLINEIRALECNCNTVDRLAEIRRELLAILPGVEIVEVGSQALARAEARMQGAATAKQQLAAIQAHQRDLRLKREALAAWLLPLVAAGGMAAVGLLTWLNVRGRLREIGLLLAIGMSSGKVLAAFLGKAVITGTTGGLLGWALATAAPWLAGGLLLDGRPLQVYLTPLQTLAILAGMPGLAAMAAWLPALRASRQDPAWILRHD